MSIVIRVENLSKQYRLGTIGTGSMAHDINRWWHAIRGKGNPYLKIGEENDRSKKSTNDYVWALRDINFDVKSGDMLGIIGRNGAGKSTLLKILSRTTSPTTGDVKIKGRVASLLEVGTGFHPELTGRENVFLNGAIMGMTKAEITKKFDEIVDFSGVERYIDTPVKRYSSGMHVRLAFAVAAYLESEILIVDEVLAVGDVEFQNKCLGKMQDVTNSEGRTVLFVSHNMGAIAKLCNKGILMNNGRIANFGKIDSIVDGYLNVNTNEAKQGYQSTEPKPVAYIEKAQVKRDDIAYNQFGTEEKIIVEIDIINPGRAKYFVGIALLDKNKTKIFTTHFNAQDESLKSKLICTIPGSLLCPGLFSLDIAVFVPGIQAYDYVNDTCAFSIVETGSAMYYDPNSGVVFINCTWEKFTERL